MLREATSRPAPARTACWPRGRVVCHGASAPAVVTETSVEEAFARRLSSVARSVRLEI